MSRYTRNSDGCLVVPITKDHDFTSQNGRNIAFDHLFGPICGIWFSSPCTGGSQWQVLNKAKGKDTAAKISAHWNLFHKLWQSFEVVADHAIRVGASVFIEWPRGCAYWREPCVVNFLRKHDFKRTHFDGCMYGMVAVHGPESGTPIRKPWAVESLNSCLPEYLNKVCDGKHKHTPCAGRNTRITEGYTPEIVSLVHDAFRVDVARRVGGEKHK